MSFLARILGRETRADTVAISDPELATFLGQSRLTGGVDPARASGLAVAQACIQAVTQNLAAVPMHLFRRGKDGNRERAQSHPLYSVLHDAFNDRMTAFEGREFLTASLMISGNAFARIEADRRGRVTALHPITPAFVRVEKLATGRLRYAVTDERGARSVYLQDEILHIRYRLAPNGYMGLSPLHIARETFALALTQQDQAHKQASRAFRPEGGLIFPQAVSGQGKADVLDRLRNKIEAQASTSGILVLDGGADWKPFALSSKDAEFLESRKLTNLDICRIYSVPPTVAGITDNATYSNVDGESRALVARCLAPMARRIEQALNAHLLTAGERRAYFIEHDLAGLLRGDLKARYEAYRIGRDGGWLNRNEIRKWENLPEIEGGEDYLTPLNMGILGKGEGGEDG